jgi:RIO-like serine/threonine protein kinase
MMAIRETLLSDKRRRIGFGKEADIFEWTTEQGEKFIWKM